MPSPRADKFYTNAVLEITAATTIANGRKKRQRVHNPPVIICRFRLALIEIDKLARIIVDEKFIVESEVRGLAGEIGDAIAPNFL